jgi:O-antigen ligase
VKIPRKWLTDAFFLFVLFISSGAMEAFTSSASGDTTQGSPLMKVLWACVYFVILISMLVHYKPVAGLLKSNIFFVALLLLAIVSLRWSVDPATTLSKSLPLLLSSFIGLEFARRYEIRDQLRLIWMVLALVLVLGVIAQVAFPGLVPDVDQDAGSSWNGIVTTKNAWARLIVLAGIVILSRPRNTRISKAVTVVLMVMILGLLVASQSAGGMLIMVAMMGLFVAFRAFRWPRKRLTFTLASLAAATALLVTYAVNNLDHLTGLLGKDATLTGRVPIWREAIIYIEKQPYLGYGYAAFWSQTSRPGRLVREAIHWDTLPHAHNGYIDLMLAVGALGLVLYLIANFVGLWRAAHYIRSSTERETMWPMALLTVCFLYQIEEGSIVSGNQIIWILLSSVLFSLSLVDTSGKPAAVVSETDDELILERELVAAD